MKKLRIALGIFGLLFALSIPFGGGGAAFSDEVVTPADGKDWGDANSTQDLLKMNHDPNILRQADPNQPRKYCTDENGTKIADDEDAYDSCMKEARAAKKAKLTKAP